jgi:nitrogen regulatory protein PII-like uncharacterized protein
MPYTYEYMNKITQFGVINYTLKLTDSDGMLPDVFLPVILSESEDNYDNLNDIANNMLANSTPISEESIQEIAVVDQTQTENIQNTSDTVTDNV